MKYEFFTKRNFKQGGRLLLFALLAAPVALAGLCLLCLGRSLLSAATAPDSALPVELPLVSTLWQTSAPESDTASAETAELWDQSVTLTVLVGEEEVSMTLGDYLWGVVSAEMPADFEMEALKAQAVAARTYTVYKLLHQSSAHTAQVCTDADCCQAWLSREERMEKWGDDAQALAEKITAAVTETDGMVMCWEGEPIQAVFHAASSGVTRSALEVWGSDVPYLQSVATPEGEEVPNYYSVVTVSTEEFASALAGEGCDLSGAPEAWIGEIAYDESGLSESVVIGGVTVSTARLRTLFSLRSASLTVEASADGVTFYVTGYGHGVGMSQYGANELAGEGQTWEEILTWYYSGAEAENFADKAVDLE